MPYRATHKLMLKYLLICALLLVMQSIVARADSLHDNLIIFGDSLSDSENPSTNDPGYPIEPRVWGQYLVLDKQSFLISGQLKTTANTPLDPMNDNIDFAKGGATAQCAATGANCLGTQISQYLALLTASNSVVISPSTKIIMWIGGNDLLNNPDAVMKSPSQVVGEIMPAISLAIQQLKNQETMTTSLPYKIYLIDLASLGKIPRLNGNPAVQAAYDLATLDFDQALGALATSLSDTSHQITLIDVNQLFRMIATDPNNFGFDNPSAIGEFSACTSASTPDPTCRGYVFYDDVHPTTALHAIVADLIGAAVFPLSPAQK